MNHVMLMTALTLSVQAITSETGQRFDCSNCSRVDLPIVKNLSSDTFNTTCSWNLCNWTESSNFTNATQRSLSGITAWTSVQFSILPILLLLIACIGLIGNALNLLVLYSYHTTQIACGGECTARVNLLGLAVADFLVCLAALPLGYVQRRHRSYSFMLFYTLIGPGLVTYFLAVSVWMVLLMSVVRYMAVCRPLTSRTWLTSRHMCRVILLIYVIALVFHIPSFFMFTYEEESVLHKKHAIKCRAVRNTTFFNTYSNVTVNQTNECESPLGILVFERSFWRSEAIYIGYHVIHIILTNIGPFIGVLVSNIAVIRACRRSDACRRSFVNPSVTSRDTGLYALDNNSPQRFVFKNPMQTNQHRNFSPRDIPYTQPGLIILNNPSVGSYRMSLQRYPNSATNRVTPLLLAVIIAFLLFTAPFGIVHFVCLQLMRKLGVRVRDNREARQLYTALNLTVEWTNVVQLLGCALNFFLYFLVSTIFRRTTKRTFRRLYKQMRGCRSELFNSLFLIKNTKSLDSWEQDTRTNELRRELEYKVAPAPYTAPTSRRCWYYSSSSNRGFRPFRSSSSMNGRLTKFMTRKSSRTIPSTRILPTYRTEKKIHSNPLPDMYYSRTCHSSYDSFMCQRLTEPHNQSASCSQNFYPTRQISLCTHCVHCIKHASSHRSLPGSYTCGMIPFTNTTTRHTVTRSDPSHTFDSEPGIEARCDVEKSQCMCMNRKSSKAKEVELELTPLPKEQREVQSTEM